MISLFKQTCVRVSYYKGTVGLQLLVYAVSLKFRLNVTIASTQLKLRGSVSQVKPASLLVYLSVNKKAEI